MKDWEKEFDFKFVENSICGQTLLAPQGEEGIEEIKQFIKEKIIEVTDEMIGKSQDYARTHEDLWILMGYNKKRDEIINIRDKYLNI